MSEGMDRREDTRFQLQVPVTVECSGRVVEMVAVNISRSGMLLAGPELVPVGQPLTLRLNLTRDLELQGVVRHAVNGCGVQFVAFPPEEQARLTAYLEIGRAHV